MAIWSGRPDKENRRKDTALFNSFRNWDIFGQKIFVIDPYLATIVRVKFTYQEQETRIYSFAGQFILEQRSNAPQRSIKAAKSLPWK